jgi:hypothetical protein
MPILKLKDLSGHIRGGTGSLDNPFEEIIYPLLIISRIPDHVQPIVIFLATLLEIVTQVQERLVHDFLPVQEKSNQQAPHATVAIKEGMDRFELVMDN